MYLCRKPLLTSCLSPKAITGEGAPSQHLNLIPAKRRMANCHLLWHVSDTSSEVMHKNLDLGNVTSVRVTLYNHPPHAGCRKLGIIRKLEHLHSSAALFLKGSRGPGACPSWPWGKAGSTRDRSAVHHRADTETHKHAPSHSHLWVM